VRASSGGFVKISTRSETSNPYLTRVRKRRAGHPSVGAGNRSLEAPSRDLFNGGNRVVPNRGADLVQRRLVHVPGLVIDPVFTPARELYRDVKPAPLFHKLLDPDLSHTLARSNAVS